MLTRDPTLARLGAEGYRAEVSASGVLVSAPEAAGLFYGLQTIRQLLPPQIFREAKVEGVAWTMPAVTIEDRPRFGWRGAHLDVGRHFMPKEFVKKYIDLLALHKLNTFHWHLTEDQGWRIEIKKYPQLTEVGAWRAETLVGRPAQGPRRDRYDGVRHGGFYTQDDIREIVAYAARPLHHRRAGDRDARARCRGHRGVSGTRRRRGRHHGADLLGRVPTTS